MQHTQLAGMRTKSPLAKLSLVLLLSLLTSCVVPTRMSDVKVKQQLTQITQSTAKATRQWLALHPGQAYRLAVLDGSTAFLTYTHIALNENLFASSVMSQALDTDWKVAKQTAAFLNQLWFYERHHNFSRSLVSRAIVQGIEDATKAGIRV